MDEDIARKEKELKRKTKTEEIDRKKKKIQE